MDTTVKWFYAKDVMTRDVLAAKADWPLNRLAEFLLEHGISGAPVISEDGVLVGVVSLTDLVRFDELPERDRPHEVPAYYRGMLDRYAPEELSGFRVGDASNTLVRDIMTPSLFRVEEDTPVQEVAEMMIRGKIHRLFVTRNHKIVGIITAMDMLRIVRDL